MSLPALPAFTDDCVRRGDGLAAILVTRRARPRGVASDPAQRIVREERRACPPATSASHTRGHIAYPWLAADSATSVARRATLFGWRRNDAGDVLAAPRSWKNDFR
jgi:hypothetical protein